MNKLNPICDAPPPAGAEFLPVPLPVPLPQLRNHIQRLLDTHESAPDLAAALREVFRPQEGWLIPELLPAELPAVMVFVSVDPARPVGQVLLRASLTRLPTTGLWSLLFWELEEDASSQELVAFRRSPPTVGAERAVVLATLAISMYLLHALGVWSEEVVQPEALASALQALGMPAELTTASEVPSVLARDWLLELRGGEWRGRCLGGPWVGPIDVVRLAMQWAQQLAQEGGAQAEGVRHG